MVKRILINWAPEYQPAFAVYLDICHLITLFAKSNVFTSGSGNIKNNGTSSPLYPLIFYFI